MSFHNRCKTLNETRNPDSIAEILGLQNGKAPNLWKEYEASLEL